MLGISLLRRRLQQQVRVGNHSRSSVAVDIVIVSIAGIDSILITIPSVVVVVVGITCVCINTTIIVANRDGLRLKHALCYGRVRWCSSMDSEWLITNWCECIVLIEFISQDEDIAMSREILID